MPFLILFGFRFKAAVLSDVSTNAAAAADVLLNTFHAINHRLVSPAIYQQLLPRLGAGDGQYIRRQTQSLFTPLRNLHCRSTQTDLQCAPVCTLRPCSVFLQKDLKRGPKPKDYICSSFFTTVIQCFHIFFNFVL